MNDLLRNWLDDVDEEVPIYGTRDWYREALHLGITDRRVVANAIALVEAANELANDYPFVPYDDLVAAFQAALAPEAMLGKWQWRYFWHWGRLGVVQRSRRLRVRLHRGWAWWKLRWQNALLRFHRTPPWRLPPVPPNLEERGGVTPRERPSIPEVAVCDAPVEPTLFHPAWILPLDAWAEADEGEE